MKLAFLALAALLAAISLASAQTASDTGGTIIPRVSAVSAIVQPAFSFTPSTTAYASGYSLGGVQAIATQPLGAIIENVSCQLSSGTFAGSIDLDVFNAVPSAYADNAAVTLSVADQAALVGTIHLTDVSSQGGALTSVQALNAAFAYGLNQGGNNGTLYVLPIVRAAVTFAASSTVVCNFNTVR
jgi:hypothetical protein